MMNRTDLKNCPCCNSDKVYMQHRIPGYKIICSSCGIETRWFRSAKEAEKVWNKRENEKQKCNVHSCWIVSGEYAWCGRCATKFLKNVAEKKECPECGALMYKGEII